LSKHSELCVAEALYNSNINLGVDTGKYKVSSKQVIDFGNEAEVERIEDLMFYNEVEVMLLQYSEDEHKIVLWGNEENGAVKYTFKLGLVNEAEKAADLKKYIFAEIKDSNEDEGEAYMPSAKEESVLELKGSEAELDLFGLLTGKPW